jgi:hypothetical protein
VPGINTLESRTEYGTIRGEDAEAAMDREHEGPPQLAASIGKRQPALSDPTHFAAWHPIEGDAFKQLGYSICSCGWHSSLARRWSGYGQWRDHVFAVREQREQLNQSASPTEDQGGRSNPGRGGDARQ